jgi:hypothetical protein
MRAVDIMPPEPLFEMSFRKKKAEQIVTGLERQINYHLLKLLGFDAAPETRAHWKVELDEWLSQIAVIKLKPDNKPIPRKLAFEWLYDEPFGGSEEQNTALMLGFVGRKGLTRNAETSAVIAAKLKEIHEQLAQRIARNNAGEDIIAAV